jgi:cytochrome c1
VLAACDSSPRPPTPGVDDAERGRRIIGEADCGACHTIPGVRGARGVVAAPLTAFARRSFIAGEVPNTRENLVRWIRDPRSIEPGTAMPALGLDEGQARDVAAYLDQLR